MHGVGFVVIGDQKNRVIKWKVVNDRICVLRIKGKFFNYSLINIYAPTNDKPDDDKDAFYERLDKTYGECPRHDVKIVIGDANAQVGKEAFFHPVIGKESLHPRTNDNGLRLVNFAAARGMAICSTFFARKNIRKHTWRHPNGESCTQIDHVLVDGRHFSDVMDVRSYRGPNIDSDHFLVACKIRARLSNVLTPRTARIARLNVQRLASSDVAAEYSRKLDERINEDAPTVIGTTRGRKPKGWFDAECQRVTDEKNEARKRMLVKGTRRNCERYSELRRAEKRTHRRKEREYDERVLAEAQAQYNANDKRRFYATVNGEGNLLTDKTAVAARWKEHFQQLLNGETREGIVEDRMNVEDDGIAVDPPTLEDVEKAVKELKNAKSAGKDGLPAELFKHGSARMIEILHQIVQRIWCEEQLPTDWLDGLITPIYKKGQRLDCANYRGITILNSAYKVLSRILWSKLRPLTETFVGEYQCGFRAGRSTTDQMFTLRQILDKFREYNLQTHHLFIDFKAAYDSVKRNELWKIMLEHGFPAKLIRLIRATLDGAKSSVRIANETSEAFVTLDGLKQGDALSNLLFIIVLEGAARRAGVQRNGTLITKSHMLLGYADDIDIIGIDRRSVEEAFVPFKREAAKIGLTINTAKTKYLVAGRARGSAGDGVSEVEIDGERYEVVDEFVYLGTLVTCDNDPAKVPQPKDAYENHAVQDLDTPVALYGHESWTLKEADQRALGVFERRILRTIFGGKQVGDRWRRRMNFELYQDYKHADIVKVIKHDRLKWAGHVARMSDERAAKTIFSSEPGRGRRLRGRPRTRWLCAVDEDARAANIVGDWRRAAQDRASWKSSISSALGR
ncbi:uncharacterized protein LOC119769300 [Culex quinquefasciatus]|uniref:uncharacterized protein LOC119769300 n=1 Tax=Culex quinquefasciatus TaxID=7176 RepID=UPI0018E2F740|nr:uncharacterized protein LOC119769300 [Culex quinquefasciatus]